MCYKIVIVLLVAVIRDSKVHLVDQTYVLVDHLEGAEDLKNADSKRVIEYCLFDKKNQTNNCIL